MTAATGNAVVPSAAAAPPTQPPAITQSAPLIVRPSGAPPAAGPPVAAPKSSASNASSEPPSAAPQNPPVGSQPDQPAPAAGPPDPTAQAAAEAVEPAPAKPDSVLLVPFPAPAGAAAFRRGNTALIVFDQRRAINLAPLRDDPVFGAATVQLLPTATVIRVPLEADMSLTLSQSANAWRTIAGKTAPTLRPIASATAGDRMALSAAAPGMVITLIDPDTGTTLLVGTQRREGQGLPVRRRALEFALLPTWQGVAVEAIADTIALRPVQSGFILTGGARGLTLSPSSDFADLLTHSAGLTRQFDFPGQPTSVLLQQLRREVTEDATTPLLSRGPRRQAVARTMISLGLGAEAQAMLQMAAIDDPNEAASPDNAALASIAAVLAHRPQEATGLGDPQLPGADDIALWRAVRQAELQAGSAGAAAVFTATLPLVLAYPAELRSRVLPLVAETMVAAGETDSAAALLDARKEDNALDFARAMLMEAKGDNVAALARYAQLTQSRNRSLHARAAIRSVELQLASGEIDTKEAAARLDKLLYAWRGDQHERLLRERLADLKARSGAWRSALTLLRETETLFPDDKTTIHAGLTDMFTALLRGNAADALAPLELAALAEENADLLPDGIEGEALEARLADRLLALDLPKRAEPVLE